MPLIDWREEFSLGVPAVDHEHRELIGLINQTYETIAAQASAAAVAEFLGEIHARIAAHFALEERVMRETGYDRFQAHKDDHERLLDDIRDMMDACETGTTIDEAALSSRLGDWFTDHFRTEDARLHKHLG